MPLLNPGLNDSLRVIQWLFTGGYVIEVNGKRLNGNLKRESVSHLPWLYVSCFRDGIEKIANFFL